MELMSKAFVCGFDRFLVSVRRKAKHGIEVSCHRV